VVAAIRTAAAPFCSARGLASVCARVVLSVN
jgi:hypothetical protein